MSAEAMKIAVAAFASRKGLGRVRELLTCAAGFPEPRRTQLWLLDGGADQRLLDETLSLPADTVCHVTLQEPRLCSAEEWMPALTRLYQGRQPQAVLFCSDLAGNELAVRLAARIEGSCATGVSSLSMDTSTNVLTIDRAAYGSNLTARFDLKGPWVLSVAKGAFEPTQGKGSPEKVVVTETLPDAPWHKDLELRTEEAEEGVETAEVVVIGGRGVGNRENMEKMRRLAQLMDGKLGGTRPTVLDAWLKHKDLVGTSGSLIRPKLCLAMGVSGAGPFMAGVEKSGVLVAVNNDPDALIFKYCDVGVVEDCNALASELQRILETEAAGSTRTRQGTRPPAPRSGR
jgi:electron transfer flavoprotein alpha subunit